MITKRRSLMMLTWVALAALAFSSAPAAGESISPQRLAAITIAASDEHDAFLAADQVTPNSVTIEVPIATGSDDAGINAASDWCVYGANHNEIYFGQCADGADVTSGFRFNPVAIPRGAHIVEAHIRFTVEGPYTGAMTVRFRGEASSNAQAFGDDSRPDNRPLIPDVNGDGYDDIAIGALWYDGSQVDEGAAFVYHGGPSSTTAVTLTSFAVTPAGSGHVPAWIVLALLTASLAASGARRKR